MPPLRPLQPHPGDAASRTTQAMLRSARKCAAVSPVAPPPKITTSVTVSRSSSANVTLFDLLRSQYESTAAKAPARTSRSPDEMSSFNFFLDVHFAAGGLQAL